LLRHQQPHCLAVAIVHLHKYLRVIANVCMSLRKLVFPGCKDQSAPISACVWPMVHGPNAGRDWPMHKYFNPISTLTLSHTLTRRCTAQTLRKGSQTKTSHLMPQKFLSGCDSITHALAMPRWVQSVRYGGHGAPLATHTQW